MGNLRIFVFAVYLVFGLYLINIGINFVTIPEAVSSFNNWIILIGGCLILLGGFNYLRASKKPKSALS